MYHCISEMCCHPVSISHRIEPKSQLCFTSHPRRSSLHMVIVRAWCLDFLQTVAVELPWDIHGLLMVGSVEDGQANWALCQGQQHGNGLVTWRWPGSQFRLQGIRSLAGCQGGEARSEGQGSMDQRDVNVILVHQDSSLVPGYEMRPGQRCFFGTGPVNSANGAIIEHRVVIPHELNGIAPQMLTSLQLSRDAASIFGTPSFGQISSEKKVCGCHAPAQLLVLCVQVFVH